MPELSTLGATIKTAYEGQPNTNAFTDAYEALLNSLGAGATIMFQDEGSNLVARSIVNFVGAGVTASDDGTRAVITIPGGGTSSGTVRASTGVAAQTPYTHSVDTPIIDLVSGGVVPATAFGIYPNSGADETTRIQNALLDLANEGSSTVFGRKRALYFQNGVYLTTGINSTTSTAIVGDGGAVFQYNGAHGSNTYVLKVTIPGGGSRVTYGICRGIKINGLSSAGELAETGIWCATATDWSTLLSQVHIVNCGLYGVRIIGVTNLLISDFRCDAVGRSAIKIEQPDLRQDLIAINQGTVTWNTPGNIAAWANQGYIAAGSVGGAVAYWGAAVLELAHPGGNGGGCFVAMRDMAVEWHLDGDPAGCGVILDRNAGNLKVNRLHLSNIRGFSDSTTNGHQIVAFNGTNGNQPQVTAFNACLDGTLARSVRDVTVGVNYGSSYTQSFCWAPGRFFSENGSTMAGLASARPAANQYINGCSYLAIDTLALSYVVNGAWATVAGGSGGTYPALQSNGTQVGTAQPSINFAGAGVTVTADAGNARNTVTIPGGSGGTTLAIQDEGTLLGTQPALNFVGAGVTVTADAGNARNVVTIPGGGGSTTLAIQDEGTQVGTPQPALNFVGAGVSVAADAVNGRNTVSIPGNQTLLVVQDEGTQVGVSQPILNFAGAGVTVTADPGNTRQTVTIPGGGTGGGITGIDVQQFGSQVANYPKINFTGNVAVTDDPTNARVNINVPTEPAEALAGGTLTPNAIVISRRQVKYSQYNQSGAVNFALDLPNCTYNLGEAIFYFNSSGAALTWNTNLVYAQSGVNSDLPATLAAGMVLIVISYDEANSRGLVYFAGGVSGGGTANALPLAGGTMTGGIILGTGARIDGGGQQIYSWSTKTIENQSGTLTMAGHSNCNVMVAGDVTVPAIEGFSCRLIFRVGAKINFKTVSTDATAGWVVHIHVVNANELYTEVSRNTEQLVFSGAAPSIIGTYGSASQAAGTNQNWTTYVLGSGATLLVVTIHMSAAVGVTTNSVTWTATGASAQVMTFKVLGDDGTGNQAYIFYLYSPNVGTAAGAGTIHATLNGAGAAMYFTAYSIKDVAIGATPISGAQGGTQTDPAALSLTGVPDRSLLIHAATAQATGITATFGAGETKDLDAAGTNFRAATSHKSVAVGGTITVDLVWSGAPTKTSDAVIAFGGV